MRGILGVIVVVSFAASALPVSAEYLRDSSEQRQQNTDAKAPKGLGPIKFDMTPAQAKRLCRSGWKSQKPAGNARLDHTARCDDLPMDLGLDDYSITLHFYGGKLVSVALIKPLVGTPGIDSFSSARSALRTKYGNVPDRTDDYRNSRNPEMQRLMKEWGSIYEWRFERSDVASEAAQIKLVRFTLDGVQSMLLVYDSQRRQDRNEELSRPATRRAQNAY